MRWSPFWTLKYVFLALTDNLPEAQILLSLEALAQSIKPAFFFALATFLCGLCAILELNGLIESVTKVLMRHIILLILPRSELVLYRELLRGLTIFFHSRMGKLCKSRLGCRLYPVSWSTVPAVGLNATYSIYTSAKEDIARNGITAAVGNTVWKHLARLTVIPAMFALAPSQG
jgi:NSS family neurotransmitter:Na+ symporter